MICIVKETFHFKKAELNYQKKTNVVRSHIKIINSQI